MPTEEGKTSTEGTTQQSAPEGTGEQTPVANDPYKAPASQEELNRIIADRIARVEAKYKDTPELRKKAAEFDKLVEKNRTAEEAALARAEAAEKRAADLEAAEQQRIEKAEQAQKVADWKAAIVADSKFAGVPASALRGTTEEELREHAAELKALIPDPDARRGGGAYVPAEGRQPTGAGSADPRQLFADIIQKA